MWPNFELSSFLNCQFSPPPLTRWGGSRSITPYSQGGQPNTLAHGVIGSTSGSDPLSRGSSPCGPVWFVSYRGDCDSPAAIKIWLGLGQSGKPHARVSYISIHPHALLLKKIFQVAHLGVEDLVVVVFFELLDVFEQLVLLANRLGQTLLPAVAGLAQLVEVQ